MKSVFARIEKGLNWRMRAGARTVQLHEGIERPILRIIVLFMLVGLTKRPGLEVNSLPELEIIADLRSPLIKESKSGSARYTKRGHGTRTPSTL